MASAFQRRVAGFALMAFLVGLGLPFAGGHLGFNNDDPACGPEVVGSLGQTATVQASSGVAPLQHCAICHLQRATSGAAPTAPIGALGALRWTGADRADDSQRVTSAARNRQPARAPPASLLS